MADLKLVETMVRGMLKNNIGDGNPSEDDIKTAISQVAMLLPMDDTEKDYLENYCSQAIR